MSTVILKCPNCGGGVSFNDGSVRTICRYCGSEVINRPDPPKNRITRSYLIITQKMEQIKHIVDDEVTFSIAHRRGAMMGDEDPMDLTASSKNNPLPLRIKCGNIIPDKIQIIRVDDDFFVNKGEKIKLFLNGAEVRASSFKVGYGDLLRIGDIVIRLQPI